MEYKFNKFVTFSLNDQEEESGSTFHPLQLAVLHNRRSQVATQMMDSLGQNDPANPIKNMLYQAQLKGEMDVLDWIIALSENFAAAQQARELAKKQAENPTPPSN